MALDKFFSWKLTIFTITVRLRYSEFKGRIDPTFFLVKLRNDSGKNINGVVKNKKTINEWFLLN